MFENIIGHKKITSFIKKEVIQGIFPPAVLLTGNPYSGKLSIALEIARIISCTRNYSWGCECEFCLSHRDLSYPYLAMVGWRYFEEDIVIASRAYQREPSNGTYYLFVRSIQKLIHRFNSFLLEGDKPLPSFTSTLDKLRELIEELLVVSDSTMLRNNCLLIEQHIKKLSNLIKTKNIAIDQIRKIHSWLNLSSPSVRILIIENVEFISESSGNALLRMIEEPAENSQIILLATRVDLLSKTLRSRLRVYPLCDRTEDEEKKVLNYIFRMKDEGYNSVKDYFQLSTLNESEFLSMLVNDFWNYVTETKNLGYELIKRTRENYRLLARQESKVSSKIMMLFFEKILLILRQRLIQNQEVPLIQKLVDEINKFQNRYLQLSIQPRYILYSLSLSMRAIYTSFSNDYPINS